MLPYESCLAWLREKAEQLETLHYQIELKENSIPMRSVLLKASNVANEAELVIWENGNISLMVFNVALDNYDIDRHDLVLNDDQFARNLTEFFDLLATSK